MQDSGIKFKDPITSFGANKKYSGVIASARYRGFDRIIDPMGLTFKIAHDQTGEMFPDINQVITGPWGSWASRQGTIIKEDSPIPLEIETNAGNALMRIDLLVGRHYHDTIAAGGINASYHIIKGPLNSATEPPITIEPQQTVVLGKFYIPANASSMVDVRYVPERAPTLGGKLPALLDDPNRYTSQQQDAQSSNVTVISVDYELGQRGVILALDGGNTFKAENGLTYLDLLPDKPNGTEINIHFISPIEIHSFIDQVVDPINGNSTRAGYLAGMRPILISNTAGVKISVRAQQIVKFVKVNTGGAYNNTPGSINYIWGDCWKLVSISDNPEKILEAQNNITQQGQNITQLQNSVANLINLINNINPPRSLKWIDYVGNYNSDFDSQGKALSTSPYYGYHIANGNGTTPNYLGRTIVGYNPSDFDFSQVGFTGGLKKVSLTGAQNGPHTHGYSKPKSASNVDNGGGTRFADFPEAAQTASSGNGEAHENMPPYRVALPLMWIGVPTP